LLRAARFAGRRPGEALLLARMAGWVLALSALIKLLPLPHVLRLVAAAPRPARADRASAPPERLAQLLDALLGLNLFVFTPTCWKRAPVLQRYLALNGVGTRIVFGVRKDGGDALAGHAWLERDGQPVFEPHPPDYIVTYGYP
jgi:hypothetical protein